MFAMALLSLQLIMLDTGDSPGSTESIRHLVLLRPLVGFNVRDALVLAVDNVRHG